MSAARVPSRSEARWPLLSHPGFARFWAADTVSMFGTAVTGVALPVLAVDVLGASATEQGFLNAARWLPYLLFGLIAGVLVDRVRRRPILVAADLVRAVVLGVIPLLFALRMLSMVTLSALMLVFGTLSLVYDAAHQSYLPRLVPTALLTSANARLQQTSAVAQTAGPTLAGGLLVILSAPLAVLVDAVSYLASGVVLATLRVDEPEPQRSQRRDLRGELREGLSWVYRHRALAPLSIATHAWFLCNSMVTTIYAVYALRELRLGALALGVTYAVGGVGAVLGASVSTRTGERLGVGPAIIAARWVTPAGYALMPLATQGTTGVVLLCASQFLFGVSIGVDSPIELGYRQAITPDRLQGRASGTIRSLNRGAIVIGAPIGGALADWLGNRPALCIAIAGLTAQAIVLACSPFRRARAAGCA
jgi:MFS family permease